MSIPNNQPQPPGRSGLTKHETRSTLTSFSWNWSLRSVFAMMCGGTTFVFVAFAISLNVDEARMGYIASLVSIACIAQIVSFPLMNRVREKKRVVLTLALAEPLMMIAAVIVTPWVPPHWRFWVLALAILLAASSLNLVKPFTDEWVASAIPERLRGRYLGRRFQLGYVAAIVAMIATGYIARPLKARDDTLGLGLMLAAGGVVGILSVLALRRATMPSLSARSRVRLHDIGVALRTGPFMRCIIAVALFNIPFYFGMPYYQVFAQKVARMDLGTISLMMSGYMLLRVLWSPVSSRLVQRYGPRRTLLTAGPIYVLFFFSYAVSTPDRYWPIIVGWLLISFSEATYLIGITSVLYGSVPQTPARPAYFALNDLASFGTYAVIGLVAVRLVRTLQHARLQLGPFIMTQYHLYFGVVGSVMLLTMLAPLLLPRTMPSTPNSTKVPKTKEQT